MRAHELGLIDLQDLPQQWTELIHSTVDRMHRCFHDLHQANEAMNTLKEQLVARDHQLDQIREHFDPHVHEYELMQAQRARMQEALKSAMRVDAMLTSTNNQRVQQALKLNTLSAPAAPK